MAVNGKNFNNDNSVEFGAGSEEAMQIHLNCCY